ncbi:6-pyruvoyl trahydropterin synthase family protein [Niabella hibiscisoli]|uniref:6-pyruvoyl trahydropterin synthase family protein n=1 Tax=Niabella hibiscisoli TaxID=1825928 RepID=UPI001F0F03C0|nr:6-carboxytetrahydropterin synthase [Niabella hibiscisoli]MCH5717575.1 6-carboxytetrahydropterin synthase [Niabella hibiscisoli]
MVVKVTGDPDPKTGFVMDMKELSDIIKREVLLKFDHKNLNLDTEEFKALNPTAENIAIVTYNLLRPHIAGSLDLQVRLYETPRNFVDYPANG